MMKNIYIKNHICHCTDDCITIINSYDITNYNNIIDFLSIVGSEVTLYGFEYKRDVDDWAKEWYAHNILYKMGLFRSHTKSVDLSEKEPKYRIICYNLIYKFMKLCGRI